MGKSLTISEPDRAWIRDQGWASVSRILAYKVDDAVAVSRDSETFPFQPTPGDGTPALIFVKRYRYRGFGRQLKQTGRGTFFGTDRARFEYNFLSAMHRRGVPTVRPIAHGNQTKRKMLRACFLITEGRPGVVSLDHDAIEHAQEPRAQAARRRQWSHELAAYIRRMHEAGVAHGALFWRNILVDPDPDARQRFTFIDPDRHGRLLDHPVSPDLVRADLSDFLASALALNVRAGASRFYSAYTGRDRLTAADRADLREILHQARGKARAERHRVSVAAVLGHVRRRTGHQVTSSRFRAASTAEFFAHLAEHASIPADAFAGQRVIQFVLRSTEAGGDVDRTYAIVENGRVTCSPGTHDRPVLTIESDERTWLAVVNGDADSMRLIQENQITLDGDTHLAALLARSLGA
jgi:hypothetical protein